MQNNVSNKVRLLLNELAILNQPDVSEGKFIYNIDTLIRVKSLSAELYLLANEQLDGLSGGTAEMEQISGSFEKVVENQEEVKQTEMDAQTDIQTIQPTLEESKVPEEPLNIEEITEVEVVQVPVETVHEETTPAESKMELQKEPIKEPNPVVKENRFEGKISLTRRFEYVNNLFSGQGDAFSEFLNMISVAGSLEAAMELFNKEFESRNWRRKAETADDLKALIKKAF